ncbi:hypothetical protein Bpro_0778 [Polaromonas sp. JS666]|nr:hypothetical protein Bpro_0778 [Polaromonas sp. JS666]
MKAMTDSRRKAEPAFVFKLQAGGCLCSCHPMVRIWRPGRQNSSGGRGGGRRYDPRSGCTGVAGGEGRSIGHLGWRWKEERAFLTAAGQCRSANHDGNKAMPGNKSPKAA